MKKIDFLVIFIFCVVSAINYNNYLISIKNYNELSDKKNEHEELVKNIEMYNKYEESYNIVFTNGKSLEGKLNELKKDINTKSDRVNYYKNSIDNMNKKMK